MKIKEIKSKVFHVIFDSQEELASAFLPFQEYYENIRFSGKPFTIEEFTCWYTSFFGRFSYNKDYNGFNIPLDIIKKFKEVKKLKKLVNSHESSKKLFENLKKIEKKYGRRCYIIGTTSYVSKNILEHELRHARFFVDSFYRKEVLKILKVNNKHLIELKKHLKKMSYHPKVILDEVHAYILTEETFLRQEKLWNSKIKQIRKELLDNIW